MQTGKLEAALRARDGLRDSGLGAYRMVHRGEIPEADGALDRYGDYVLATAFEEDEGAGALVKRYAPLLDFVIETEGLRGGLLRMATRRPSQRNLVREACWFGEPPEGPLAVAENGLWFGIELGEETHPGLFLDQRESRQWVREIAPGMRVANLFCFTGSFSVAALAGGAAEVFSVDLSKGALRAVRANLELNGIAPEDGARFAACDTREWLERQARKVSDNPDARYDLVICDPPVFARGGSRGTFAVEKDWPSLVAAVRSILVRRGVAFFANNHRSGSERWYRSVLEDAFRKVEAVPAQVDFPESASFHSRAYRCWC